MVFVSQQVIRFDNMFDLNLNYYLFLCDSAAAVGVAVAGGGNYFV